MGTTRLPQSDAAEAAATEADDKTETRTEEEEIAPTLAKPAQAAPAASDEKDDEANQR